MSVSGDSFAYALLRKSLKTNTVLLANGRTSSRVNLQEIVSVIVFLLLIAIPDFGWSLILSSIDFSDGPAR